MQRAARADLAGLPVLRDADRAARGRRAAGARHTARRADSPPSPLGRLSIVGDRWPSSGRLILIKPDAVRRRLAAEILGRIEARGFEIREGKLVTVEPRARGGALRGAPREAVLRRARRVHHLRADLGARRRGRRRDRDDALDDRRDGSGERRAGHDPRRSRRLDARQPRARLRLARVGRARDRALVLWPTRTSRPGRARTRSTPTRAPSSRGRPTRSAGASGRCRSPICRPCPTSSGKDVVELGCGTAYFGAWLKKAGAARVVGVDPDARAARDGAAL